MHKNTIFKQASAAALGVLLSASCWSAEITGEFTRAFSGTDIQTIQLVFEVEGDGESEYAIFAQGPSLTNEGVDAVSVLADPQISLILNNDETIDSNDNWGDDPSAKRISEVAASEGITLDALDAAMVRDLPAGLYSVSVSGADGGVGVTRVGAIDSTDVPVTEVPPDVNPGNVCSRELCATDTALAQRCDTFLATCLAQDVEVNEDECVGGALLICEGEI